MIMNSPATKSPTETGPQLENAINPREKRGRRLWWLWLLALGILAAGGYQWHKKQSALQTTPVQSAEKLARPAIPVAVAPARAGDMPIYLNGLGSVTAFNTVTVKSRVDGQLNRVAFKEGQMVGQGELLAEIDPRPFQVLLAQAEGQLAKDQALLNNAKVDLLRYQTLVEQDSVPKQQLDTQAATVGQYEGAIRSDQAQIDSAKLQLTYCKVTAPISGRAGLRLVDAGNIIHSSDQNGLVVITQVQPIAVLFTVPEDNLPPVLKKLRAGSRLPVEAYDRSGKAKIATGSLLTVDNQIDSSTGTSRLKAVFSNSDNALFPNQFVNVRLLLDNLKGAVIVPTVAVQRGPQGTFVFIVKPDQTVETRSVTLGPSEGNEVVIASGLPADTPVVVDGVDKLQSGSKVRIPTGKEKERTGRRGAK